MSNFLSIDEIKNATEPVERKSDYVLIQNKGPDRKAASQRYYFIEDFLYDWHNMLNDQNMNTRDMPRDLMAYYDQALKIMIKISAYERELMV